jgi:anti-sigma-K factor RskA
MRYDNPELRQELASRYALGTLRGPARRRFERLAAGDAALGDLTRRWEARLNALAEQAPAVEPPARLWRAIERRLAAESAAGREPAARPAGLWDSLAFWRGLAGAAAALAAGLLLYLGLATPGGPRPGPDHIAVLADAAARPALLATIDDHAGRVTLAALALPAPPADKSLQLWLIAPSQPAPRPLGLLSDGALSVALGPAAATALATGTLAVSLEPAGGSPTGLPTGPVLYQGRILATPRP